MATHCPLSSLPYLAGIGSSGLVRRPKTPYTGMIRRPEDVRIIVSWKSPVWDALGRCPHRGFPGLAAVLGAAKDHVPAPIHFLGRPGILVSHVARKAYSVTGQIHKRASAYQVTSRVPLFEGLGPGDAIVIRGQELRALELQDAAVLPPNEGGPAVIVGPVLGEHLFGTGHWDVTHVGALLG